MNVSSADKAIRTATALAVMVVSGIAALVSYSHITRVGIDHGQTILDARLTPVSVDGLIVAASLTALYAGRNRMAVPVLARFALAVGIGGTVAANLLFGISHGWLGAVFSAWPGVSFVIAVELLIWTVRAAVTGRPYSRRAAKPGAARTWAREQGFNVSDRGRLPEDVKEAYAESTSDVSSNGHIPGQIQLFADTEVE